MFSKNISHKDVQEHEIIVINTDGLNETSTIDTKSHFLQSWNFRTNAHDAGNVLIICVPDDSPRLEGVYKRL